MGKKKEEIEERTWEILTDLCEKHGFIPVDAEYAKNGGEYSLLLYIDKEGGVTIEDCETVSREADPILDEENLIDEAYTLYVSSPGLGRVLRRPRDFIFAMGKEVEIHTYKARNKEKEFRGILLAEDRDSVRIGENGEEQVFMKDEIAQIRLAFDF